MGNTVIPKVIGKEKGINKCFYLENAYFYQIHHLTMQ